MRKVVVDMYRRGAVIRSAMVHRVVAGCLAVLGVALLGIVAICAPALGAEGHTFSFSIPLEGSSEGLSTPVGGAVNQSNGNLYVADIGAARVMEFNSKGEFLLMFGKEVNETKGTNICTQTEVNEGDVCKSGNGGSEPEEFSSPFGIAVDNTPGLFEGDVYVADLDGFIDRYSATGEYLSRFNGSETAEGSFEAYGLAVNESTGNVYVPDSSHNVVDVFTPEGNLVEELFSGQLSSPGGIAIDAHGDVYVTNPGNGATLKFAPNGSGGFEAPTTINEGNTRGVAVNTATGVVYVDDHSYIQAYDEADNSLGVFGSEQFGNSPGVAVDNATHTVYAVDAGSGKVYAYETFIEPTVVTGAASNVTQVSATVEGTVTAESLPISACFFEYEVSGEKKKVSCEGALPSGSASDMVAAKLPGLKPGGVYSYTLVVEFEGHLTGGEEQKLSTTVGEPLVVSESASHVERHTALLSGEVNPENEENTETEGTTYYFEYGETENYGQTTPPTTIPAPGGAVPVKAGPEALIELHPATVYHYRLVAQRGSGTATYGLDATFATEGPRPPVVESESSSQVTQTSAELTTVVNPNGLPTTYALEVGTEVEENGTRRIAYTPTYGQVGEGGEPMEFTLSGLLPATTYHYRIVATNEDGTVPGPDQTFSTPGFAPVILAPPSPQLVPIPKEENPVVHKVETRAQKYAKAVSVCEKDKSKKKRTACLKTAKRKYGPVVKKKNKKK